MSPEAPHTPESAPTVRAELFDPSTETWKDVRRDILELEELCFPGKVFPEASLRSDFENPENIAVVLRKEDGVIGFSYGAPDRKVENAIKIHTTEIHPEEQGKGYVVSLVTMLEDEARRRGFKFLTRHAAIENGYADKITANYGDRVVETYERGSDYGPQRYFKIAL